MEESTDIKKRELDEQYIEMAIEKYERIKSIVSKVKTNFHKTQQHDGNYNFLQ